MRDRRSVRERARGLQGRGSASGRADGGTAYVAVTHTAGGFEYAAGDGRDKLLGAGAVTYKIKILTTTKAGTYKVSAKPVTLYTATGSLTGSTMGLLTIGAKDAATVKGTLKLTKGTGALAGHSWIGTVKGSGNVGTGIYVFKTKGVYR